ncbi:hypothetical protein Apmu_0200_06 [Acidiphilium multivorum AIU301]|uniref:hypothetical protein n=1 Tax=Acidiphilium multivorum TaxID=62140 RepID=UPI0005E7A06E|nr:hypothetical protein [Acidiphilium multivorum]GAN74654.1 hypothetical protein Apmu_0200_06 [Acidiphilium multivorum AIU301]
MLKRVSAAIIATGLIVGVVYLGWFSSKYSAYIWLFGLAAALAAPLGLTLLSFALNGSSSDVIKRLAKVPEIEQLINEAKNQEEKIRILEVEREKLIEIVKLESRRQAIEDRVASLENDAVRILVELENLDEEQKTLGLTIGGSNVSKEIARLRERVRARERGDLVIRVGSFVYQIDRDIVKGLPFGAGSLVLAYVKIVQKFLGWMRTRSQTHEGSIDIPASFRDASSRDQTKV